MLAMRIICVFALVGLSYATVDDELSSFRETLDTMKSEVNQLKDVNLKLMQELSERKQKEQQLLSRLEEIEDTLPRQLESTKAKHRRQMITEVGFMATVTVDEHNLHMDQSIIFDTVITNIGNGYSNRDGNFHCPVSGTYLFNFNVMALDTEYVEASLIVNGDHIVYALSDQKGTSVTWDQGSTSAILQLNQNDVVRVGNNAANNAIHGNRYTTFSGYLLRPLQ